MAPTHPHLFWRRRAVQTALEPMHASSRHQNAGTDDKAGRLGLLPNLEEFFAFGLTEGTRMRLIPNQAKIAANVELPETGNKIASWPESCHPVLHKSNSCKKHSFALPAGC